MDQYTEEQLTAAITRCEENIRIFGEEVEKQKLLKLDLQYKLAALKAKWYTWFMKSNKTLNSGLHALIWQEKKLFVSKCIELEITSQGKSKTEAISNLEEAINLFLEDEKITVPKGVANLSLANLYSGYA